MLEKVKFLDYARLEKKKIKRNILLSFGWSLFLFIMAFVLYLKFSYMGVRNEEIEKMVFSNFKALLLFINLKILLIYLIIGFMIGIFTLLLDLKKKRYVLLFNAFVWFMFWARGIKLYPQMFSEQLYRQGGLLKYFQVLITDFTPMVLIYIIFTGTIIAIAIKNKRVIHSLFIILVCSVMVVHFNVGATSAEAGTPTVTKPNILIVATDSLRPQSISYNGYSRPTPNIDRVFGKGVNFLNAKASMARTLPSWTSILTSTFPPDHGMRHMFPMNHKMKKRFNSIIDIFNGQGYYTAVVSDFAGDIFPSLNYGFHDIVSPDLSMNSVLRQRSLEMHYFMMGFFLNPLGRAIFPEMSGMPLNKDPWYVTQYTKKCINKSIDQKKPFFILYFSSNNHFPYATKDPYYRHYSAKSYYGDHKYALSTEVLETFMEKKLDKEEIEQVVNHYDNATKLFDDNLGELLAFLEDAGIAGNTLVVVMSDHGENLCEENYGLAHGDHLLGPYANTLVFGLYSPFEDFHGRRIEKTVRDIDIAPTLLQMLDYDIPETFRGKSLLPAMRGNEFPGYPVYMETGVWYSTNTPFIPGKIRIPYPFIVKMAHIEMPEGKISLKKEFDHTVIRAKYKAFQINEKKYIYMPGQDSYKEEYFINEKKVDPKDIDDPEFLTFKQKMVEMFKDKFYIDEKGFIREFITDPRPKSPTPPK